jgi:hypothetical protein
MIRLLNWEPCKQQWWMSFQSWMALISNCKTSLWLKEENLLQFLRKLLEWGLYPRIVSCIKTSSRWLRMWIQVGSHQPYNRLQTNLEYQTAKEVLAPTWSTTLSHTPIGWWLTRAIRHNLEQIRLRRITLRLQLDPSVRNPSPKIIQGSKPIRARFIIITKHSSRSKRRSLHSYLRANSKLRLHANRLRKPLKVTESAKIMHTNQSVITAN